MITPNQILNSTTPDESEALTLLEKKIDAGLTASLKRDPKRWIWFNLSLTPYLRDKIIEKYSSAWVVEFYSDQDGSGLKFLAKGY